MNETAKFIFQVLVMLELIFAQQCFIIRTMIKRCRLLPMIITDVLFTSIMIILVVIAFSRQDGYVFEGDLLHGIVFILPSLIFSKMKFHDRIIVFFAGAVYGLLIYTLSLRIAALFNLEYYILNTFAIQTTIHIIAIVVYQVKKEKILSINFSSMTFKVKMRLLIVVLLSYLLILSFNSNMYGETTPFQKLRAIFLLFSFIGFAFLLIADLWKEKFQNENLSSQMKNDTLTNLKNRSSFKKDISDLMIKNTSFSLIYIDLDRFKSINDNYGHLIGDKYLVSFSSILLEQENEKQSFYRMSGDEFCCLTTIWSETEDMLIKLKRLDYLFENIEFLGFSYGIAHFPFDADNESQLIQHADMNMYHSKKMKRKN